MDVVSRWEQIPNGAEFHTFASHAVNYPESPGSCSINPVFAASLANSTGCVVVDETARGATSPWQN